MKILKFFLSSCKKDLKLLKAIVKGEAELKQPLNVLFQGWQDTIIKNWWLWLLCFAFFISGWYLSSIYYSGKCTILINEVINASNCDKYTLLNNLKNISNLIV